MVTDRETPFLAAGLGSVGLASVLTGAAALLWPGLAQTQYVAVFALGCGLPFVILCGLTLGMAWRQQTADIRPAMPMQAPEPVSQPAPVPPIVIRRVPVNSAAGTSEIEMSENRSPRWVRWQTFSLDLLDWYVAVGEVLTSLKLVGSVRAFGDRSHWVAGTDEWARLDLCAKTNGRTTVLIGTVADVRDRIDSGKLEWRDDVDPPPIRPCPAGLRIVDVPAAESPAFAKGVKAAERLQKLR